MNAQFLVDGKAGRQQATMAGHDRVAGRCNLVNRQGGYDAQVVYVSG